MNSNDPCGPRGNHLFNTGGVHVVCLRVDVAENRGNFLPLERMRGGDKGERRDYYLPLEPQGASGDLQGDSGVAHGDAVLDTKEFGELPLKFLDALPVICHPTAVEDVVDSVKQMLTVPNVWTSHVEHLGKGRLAGKYCEVAYAVLTVHLSTSFLSAVREPRKQAPDPEYR